MGQCADNPIGVLDSGVGGLTVVRELRRLLPGENIVYFGDSANCPYGNSTREQLTAIAGNMLGFLQRHAVKMVVLACNTISSMVEEVQPFYPFPILSIVTPVSRAVARSGGDVGVIATEFTIHSRAYERAVQAENPRVRVFGQANRNLARLVERGNFTDPDIGREVHEHVGALLAAHPVGRIILGCTHYPIVLDLFRHAAPQVDFIDPATEQVREAKRILGQSGLLAERSRGALSIYTSGKGESFETMLDYLSIGGPATVCEVENRLQRTR